MDETGPCSVSHNYGQSQPDLLYLSGEHLIVVRERVYQPTDSSELGGNSARGPVFHK